MLSEFFDSTFCVTDNWGSKSMAERFPRSPESPRGPSGEEENDDINALAEIDPFLDDTRQNITFTNPNPEKAKSRSMIDQLRQRVRSVISRRGMLDVQAGEEVHAHQRSLSQPVAQNRSRSFPLSEGRFPESPKAQGVSERTPTRSHTATGQQLRSASCAGRERGMRPLQNSRDRYSSEDFINGTVPLPPIPPQKLAERNQASTLAESKCSDLEDYAVPGDGSTPNDEYVREICKDRKNGKKKRTSTSGKQRSPGHLPGDKKKLTLTENLEGLSHCSWYWGPMSQHQAEKKLALHSDGSFLVRDSSNSCYLLSLSFRTKGMTFHTRLENDCGYFRLGAFGSLKCESVVQLIEKCMRRSKKGPLCHSRGSFFLSVVYPVRILTPVSRYASLPSLQHLCRFIIRQHARNDLLNELPLPQKLTDYVAQKHYFEYKDDED